LSLLYVNSNDILVELDKRLNNFREDRIDEQLSISYLNLNCLEEEIDSKVSYKVKDYWASKGAHISRDLLPECSFQEKDSSILIYFGKSQRTASAYLVINKKMNSTFSWLNESTESYGEFFKTKPLQSKKIEFKIDTLGENSILVEANVELEFILYRKEDYFEREPFLHWIKLDQCFRCNQSEKVAEEIMKNEERYIRLNNKVINNPRQRMELIKNKLRYFY